MLAGDTDTNCAIAGGLVGAYIGAGNLPRDKVKKVLECDLSLSKEDDRHDLFQPQKGCIDEILKLVALAPTQLEIVKVE